VIKGQGHATPLRPAGDVSIKISVDWDPRLLRNGVDVHAVFRIRLLDALCGFRYSGDYFGEHMEFMSEPGQVIQTGDQLKVRGAGLPHMRKSDDAPIERGDLFVVFRVDMPSTISTKDQQLLRVILDQTALRNAEGREPIQQEELDMRGVAPGTVIGKETCQPKTKGPKVYDSRADGCRPM
jgi:DnaJ-class molecular chaperone